ncbi:hypothetical protein R3P38DRAFT_3214032 [Favolaschia claudopus]|uniref:Uncharacterized protein n=1 Tax=Favolaschia claudopus TaxID=2862362 RepID=A0AAW0ACV9_9AGAR
MPSTITDRLNLEVMLHNTVDNIVAHDETSSIGFWSRMQPQDLGYGNYDNASLERLTSKEYGELFNPEDDFDEAADAVLRANVREMRKLPGAQQFHIMEPQLKPAETAATSSSSVGEGSARPAPVALPSSSRPPPPVTHQMYAPASVVRAIAPPAPVALPSSSRRTPPVTHQPYAHRSVGQARRRSHRGLPHRCSTHPLLPDIVAHWNLAATRPPSVQNAVMTEKSTPQVIEVDDRKQGQDASAVKSTTKTVEVVAGDTGTLKIKLPAPRGVVQKPITLADYKEPKQKATKTKQVMKQKSKAPGAAKDSGDAQTRRTSKRLNPEN